ncbi:maleylpyruvate isomerase family mycothiol-dependent enzyme [Kribbella turkmenica]|uniref:Maleylpyruvate isomerase family mycothiol-dependent enzyme n=1 Tax=Kribbella turkmenica TaxID=2530375 RepID=A0A4R4WHB2_9ACTN|nr:maleylpyruvate isomerase family mycothiol-dependent enzyme [Kribbella turkmenica]TDD15723.1 maleylpyruvate isomerase family mycothiol-dependent enzyme [Kribbella turkmenica]
MRDIRPEVTATAQRVNATVATVGEAAVRAPSALPGWSRGHVITHIANFAEAMTRQVEEALAGRLVDVYDGGRAARDAAIEAGAGRPAAELAEHLRVATGALIAAWDKVGPGDWERPIRHRDSFLAAGLYATWRELAVHAVDLDLAPTAGDWPKEFCLHLLDFLRPRTPEGVQLVLRADDGTTWENGTGDPTVLTGELTDLTAWYAGRVAPGPVNGPAPELLPWP